jgi:hypothetical protein
MIVIVSCTAFVAKRTPKMIRGVMMTCAGMSASVGCVIYLQLVRWTIPNIVGYSWCFGYVAALNLLTLFVLFILILCGKFGNSAAAENEALGLKANSDEASSCSSVFSGDDDAGPMGEIDEIPEIDSEDEGTEVGSLKPESFDQRVRTFSKAGDLAHSQKDKEPLKVSSKNYGKLENTRKSSIEE